MNNPTLKQRLLNTAIAKGICSQGESVIASASTIDRLIDFYIENPDWCLERDFPDFRTLVSDFSDIGDKGVFVNRKFNGQLLNERQVYIFHHCSGTVKVGLNADSEIIPMLYVANSCRLRFVGVGDVKPSRDCFRTQIPLYTFGPNDITARDNRFVKFNRYPFRLP